MKSADRKFDARSLFGELLARFPATARLESGPASYRWLSTYAEDVQVHRNVELPPNLVVLLDAEGRRLVTVDITEFRES